MQQNYTISQTELWTPADNYDRIYMLNYKGINSVWYFRFKGNYRSKLDNCVAIFKIKWK